MSLRRATMRNAQVASITHDQSRAKLAAVINAVPRSWSRTSFLWTKERLILSWAESTPSLHFPARDCRCSARSLGCCFAMRRCSVRCLLPHIY